MTNPVTTDVCSIEDLLAAVDSEIEQHNEEQKWTGVTNWALFLALGAVLLFLVNLWEAGGLDLVQVQLVVIAATLGLDGLVQLLSPGSNRPAQFGRRVWRLPLRMAVVPPLAAASHSALIAYLIIMTWGAVPPYVAVILIFLLLERILLLGLGPAIFNSPKIRNWLVPNPSFGRGVKRGHFMSRYIEPLCFLIGSIYYLYAIPTPTPGSPSNNIQVGLAIFLVLSLLASLLEGSGHAMLDSWRTLRRFLVIRVMSIDDGRLALLAVAEGVVRAPNIIVTSRLIIDECERVVGTTNNPVTEWTEEHARILDVLNLKTVVAKMDREDFLAQIWAIARPTLVEFEVNRSVGSKASQILLPLYAQLVEALQAVGLLSVGPENTSKAMENAEADNLTPSEH